MNNKPALFIALMCLLLAIVFRTFITAWGPPTNPPGSQSTTFGLTGFPADNLSYLSWMQQAKGGRWLFGILYTTTEHSRLMFNPLFLLIGKVSSVLSVSPLLVLNIVALFSLPFFIVCFSGICRILGFSIAATTASTCLAIGGGGMSWLRKIMESAGLQKLQLVGPLGPDLAYFDVYPASAYFIYPYHAISLAIVAFVVLLIVQLDDDKKRLTAKDIVLLSGSGFLLASIRPQIPIMMLGTYWAATAATYAFRLPRMILNRRIAIATYLTVAMSPPVLYSLWVTQHPVWNNYASAHPRDYDDWQIGLFLLWILAAVGIGVLRSRILRPPFAFLACWALGSGFLLLVLNGHFYPKITAGSTIALALLAGIAIDRYKDRLHSRIALFAAVAVVAFLALASPIMAVLQIARSQRMTAPSELFQVIEAIRRDAQTPFPAVLTDCGTGMILPGLGGYQVLCGNWALTDNNRQKTVLLSGLGFLADGAEMPSFPGIDRENVASGAKLLGDQIRHGKFEYLVVQKKYRIFEAVRSMGPECTVKSGKQYAVLRMCPEIKSILERELRAY